MICGNCDQNLFYHVKGSGEICNDCAIRFGCDCSEVPAASQMICSKSLYGTQDTDGDFFVDDEVAGPEDFQTVQGGLRNDYWSVPKKVKKWLGVMKHAVPIGKIII